MSPLDTARDKSGKVQIEQMFSGLHLKADAMRFTARTQQWSA